MPDRPGRWKLLFRRQRRLLRPVAVISIVFIAGIGCLAAAQFIGHGPPLRERIGLAGAAFGMRVRDIIIEGRQKTPESLLRAALGIAKGDPILGFSVADARERIASINWVRDVTVERRLPATIIVRLTERRPFAVWQNQGKFTLIDRAGEIVADADVAVFGDQLPLVVGAGAPRAAAALLDALAAQPTLMPHVVAAVRVGDRRWNLRMKNGADVLLPEGAEPQALAKLVELNTQHALLDRPLAEVDLRLPDKLVIRPRADSTTQDKPMGPPSPPARKPT
jgi:cell division protein FtsQ